MPSGGIERHQHISRVVLQCILRNCQRSIRRPGLELLHRHLHLCIRHALELLRREGADTAGFRRLNVFPDADSDLCLGTRDINFLILCIVELWCQRGVLSKRDIQGAVLLIVQLVFLDVGRLRRLHQKVLCVLRIRLVRQKLVAVASTVSIAVIVLRIRPNMQLSEIKKAVSVRIVHLQVGVGIRILQHFRLRTIIYRCLCQPARLTDIAIRIVSDHPRGKIQLSVIFLNILVNRLRKLIFLDRILQFILNRVASGLSRVSCEDKISQCFSCAVQIFESCPLIPVSACIHIGDADGRRF